MKIAKADRKKEEQYISLDKLQNLFEKFEIQEKGMTKSGEKILAYKEHEFTITRGNTEGFDVDKIVDKIAHELAKTEQDKVPGKNPSDFVKKEAFTLAYEKLKKEIKETNFE